MDKPLKFFYTNADSLLNKIDELRASASLNDFDIMCIMETLPKTNRTLDAGGTLTVPYYTNYDCVTGRGVTIYVQDRLKSEIFEINTNFNDNIWVSIELPYNNKLLIGGIYRSPNSPLINNVELVQLFDQLAPLRNTNIIIMGDFNYKEVNWIQGTVNTRPNHPAFQLYNKINDSFLEQLILEPTRHRRGQTSNILDWVLTNYPEKTDNLQILAPLGQKGDHNVITFDYEVPKGHCQTNNSFLCYSKGDYGKINKELSETNWDSILDANDIERSWQTFQDRVNALTKRNVPEKGKQRNKKQPWVDKEVREALREKNRAWKSYRANKTTELWQSFTKVRNRTNRIIRSKKATYENDLAQEIKRNPKKFWRYLNIKRNSNRELPVMYDEGQKAFNTDLEKANQFNKYFSEVYTNENLQQSPNLTGRAGQNKLENIYVTRELVNKELNKINIIINI